MINIAELTEDDRGRAVVYRSKGGDKIEDGVISSWNDRYVFVCYGRYTAATDPADLEFTYERHSDPRQRSGP